MISVVTPGTASACMFGFWFPSLRCSNWTTSSSMFWGRGQFFHAQILQASLFAAAVQTTCVTASWLAGAKPAVLLSGLLAPLQTPHLCPAPPSVKPLNNQFKFRLVSVSNPCFISQKFRMGIISCLPPPNPLFPHRQALPQLAPLASPSPASLFPCWANKPPNFCRTSWGRILLRISLCPF